MSGSSNLNSFRDRGQVAVQLVSCGVLLPGRFNKDSIFWDPQNFILFTVRFANFFIKEIKSNWSNLSGLLLAELSLHPQGILTALIPMTLLRLVCLGCTIYRLHFCWGLTHSPNKCPVYDSKQSDGKTLVMLQSTSSLPLLSGPIQESNRTVWCLNWVQTNNLY